MKLLLLLLLIAPAVQAEDKPTSYRKLESALLTGHGATMVAAVLRKSLRRWAMPLSAILGASAYSMRLARLLTAKEGEIAERKYGILLNAAFIPLSIIGATQGVSAFTSGWRSLLPFMSKGGWREKLVSLNWLVSVGIYGVTDTYAHISHGKNPLKSREWLINRLYTIFGAMLTANALNRSGTLLGRIEGTLIMSAAYALFNSMVQEIMYVLGDRDTDYRHLKFDQMWGLGHSLPRNLIDWSVWHWLAGKATSLPSAAWVGAMLSTLRIMDSIQRANWYANAKLDYLEGNTWWQAMKRNALPRRRQDERSEE